MKDSLNDIARIERYLEGKLDSGEHQAFEKELETNTELAELVVLQKDIVDGVVSEGLKRQLKQYHTELFERPNKKSRWYYIGAAASLALLVTSIYLFFDRSTSNEELFVAYFDPYPNLVTTRGNITNNFKKGMENYSNRNYNEAILDFEEIDKNEPEYTEMIFYKGVSHLALNQPTKAVELFEQFRDFGEYNEQAIWYLGMGYLKLGNIENVQKQLLQLKFGDFKYREAQELLEQLGD
ncbi:MAG: hypothetical protein ABJF04_06060 [Reichenbachiella sp.]|uniref:hypothetical protein n=1 Tax=Reichenbachiella sp. TaxID=2184521 RepID=UPI00326674B0